MRDLYQEVTAKILADLEKGVAPWVKPWKATDRFGGNPYNAMSRKPYRGINQFLLYAPQYARNGWMTYKQASDIGANVRKGERGSLIVFYKPFVVSDKNAPVDGKEHSKTIPLLRCFHVFNLEQIENLPKCLQSDKPDERTEVQRHEQAETILSQALIVHGGDRACYSPAQDQIRLPQPGAFVNMASYYGTALHELTHWTGHASRCEREYGKRFGDTAYAREELVAEMGAAFLCGHCGIDGKLQHSDYIASWISVLKADKRAVLIAASHAQKAADFVLKIEQAEEHGEEAMAA
jgi:antirestriction protein ArdC